GFGRWPVYACGSRVAEDVAPGPPVVRRTTSMAVASAHGNHDIRHQATPPRSAPSPNRPGPCRNVAYQSHRDGGETAVPSSYDHHRMHTGPRAASDGADAAAPTAILPLFGTGSTPDGSPFGGSNSNGSNANDSNPAENVGQTVSLAVPPGVDA